MAVSPAASFGAKHNDVDDDDDDIDSNAICVSSVAGRERKGRRFPEMCDTRPGPASAPPVLVVENGRIRSIWECRRWRRGKLSTSLPSGPFFVGKRPPRAARWPPRSRERSE